MANFVKILLLIGLFAVSDAVSTAANQSTSTYDELENSPYKLADRMATDGASSLQVSSENYAKIGIWAEDRFLFPGAPEDSEVLVSGNKIDDKPIEIIELQPRKNSIYTLKFLQIKASPRLVLLFKAPPSETSDKPISAVYVRVYIGKILLERVRLSSDSEWVRKEYALGNAQFIKQKLTLTLSITSDSDEAMLMLFGYLKS